MIKAFNIIKILCSVFVAVLVYFVYFYFSSWSCNHDIVNKYIIATDAPSVLQFRFSPLSLIQGCIAGDLPYHFYLHPDVEDANRIINPGISTYKDFILFSGIDFNQDEYIDSSVQSGISDKWSQYKIKESVTLSEAMWIDSKKYEEKGLKFVRKNAENGNRFYQTILAGYHFYFGDTRKGLYWAEKAAEQGETGSMNILAHAYEDGIGIYQDGIESLKWLKISSNLGNLAATGQLLSRGALIDDSEENMRNFKRAHQMAKEWIISHERIFISDE